MLVSMWLYVVGTAYLIIMHYWGWLIASCLFLICCVLKYARLPLFAVSLVMVALLVGLRNRVNTQQIFRVIQIKENYIIAANKFNGKIIIYDRSLEYGSLFKVEKLQEITGMKNPLIFNFPDYLKHSGITFQGLNPQVISIGKGMANYLYRYYDNLEEGKRNFVKIWLYQQEKPDSASDFVFSSGLALRQLLRLLSIPLLYFFDRRHHQKIVFLLSGILCLFFPMLLSLKIILLFRLFKWLFPQESQQLPALVMALLVWDDSYLLHPTFLYIYLQYFASFINLEKTVIKKLMSRFFIQLLLFKKTNILLTVGFSIYSLLQAITLFFALLAKYLPWDFLLWWQQCLLALSDVSAYFSITTLPSFISLAVFVVFLTKKQRFYEILLPLVLPLIQFQQFFNPFSTVTLLDCGQADCTVVALAFNRYNLLIDAGNNFGGKCAENVILPYLEKQGIFKINNLIVSHDDYDHSGSIAAVIQQINVDGLVYYPQTIKVKNLQILIPGDVGDNVNYQAWQIDNENSLIVLLQLNNLSILFCGDIGKMQEIKLLQLYDLADFSLLKLAHHGSDTASSSELLSLPNWRYALISSGRHNRYGHPSPEVIKRLRDFQLPYLNTSQTGYISLYSVFGINFIESQQGKIVYFIN